MSGQLGKFLFGIPFLVCDALLPTPPPSFRPQTNQNKTKEKSFRIKKLKFVKLKSFFFSCPTILSFFSKKFETDQETFYHPPTFGHFWPLGTWATRLFWWSAPYNYLIARCHPMPSSLSASHSSETILAKLKLDIEDLCKRKHYRWAHNYFAFNSVII